MNISFDTPYSGLLIVLSFLFSAVISYWFYKRDKKLVDMKNIIRNILMVFRFISIFIILLLILSPIINSITTYIEKPLIIIAHDNSESVKLNSDSILLQKLPNSIDSIINQLSENYDVKTLSFSNQVEDTLKYSYNGKITSFSNLFKEIENRYSNQNIGALIIASDGIYNEGSNPYYNAKSLNYPLYTIALGDSSEQKDIYLKEVICNKIAFLGNKFPVQLFYTSTGLNGKESKLIVSQNDNQIFTKPIIINKDNFSETVSFEIDAKSPGLQHYKVEIVPVENEANIKNNVKKIAIDVIDNRQKILILSNSTHPDIGALKSALTSNQNFEIECLNIDKFKSNISQYNLVILHQLPSLTNNITNVLTEINKSKIPVLFILGSQSNIKQINSQNLGIAINQSKNSSEDAKPFVNKDFTYFELSDDMKNIFSKYPPLVVPFGDYKTSPNCEVMLFQTIKTINTAKPLLFFINNSENKAGFILGEGIWRWKINNYIEKENHDLFNEFVNKIVQYLALKVQKDQFVLNHKKMFNEAEFIIFDAEYYNNSFELNNDGDLTIDIIDNNGIKYPFTFNKTEKTYRLNAGIFKEGIYTYIASLKVNDKMLTKKGSFSILPINIESENTIANHKLLKQLSELNGGLFTYPLHTNKITVNILQNKNIAPIMYSEKNIDDIINFKVIFALILILLSLEWFLRKYYGSY